jgi:tetratricopeptide (TPR) repeat protein
VGPILIAALIAAACGAAPPPPFPIERPAQYETGILRSEAAARRLQGTVVEGLAGLAPGGARSLRPLLTDDFAARFGAPGSGRALADESVAVHLIEGGAGELLEAEEFLARLDAYIAGWSSVERREFELDRFFLDRAGRRATGRGELYLAGERLDGGRADLRAICEVACVESGGTWRLAQLDLLEAVTIEAGVPTFVDVTDAVGLHYLESEANREMLQAFIDEHRILALGGLSAVDWNEDGFPDVIGTLDGSLSVLFLNDGLGGFVRRKLPLSEPVECATFLLHLDLDGDGTPELASSKVIHYEGDRASCGLYVRESEGWTLRREAFSFSNTVGLRGIAIQTIVPFDANGDGLLDLFFGVYGNNESRSTAYNLVEAHDGGDNYLFINQGNLEFREESDERGIRGTQYTYVALPHDFDGDGDLDLFEGNDFGPNVLWENDGSGHFRAAPDSVFSGESAYTMGITLSDHDDDGRLSLYVVNMSSEAGQRISRIADGISEGMRQRVETIASGNMLYTQALDGSWFEHASMSSCAEGEWGWGALFFDLDGDGDDELFATNGFTSHSDLTTPDWDPYFWRQVAADGASMERGERSHDINEGQSFRGSYAGRQRDRLFLSTEEDRERFFDVAWHYGLDREQDGRCALPLDFDGDGDLDLVLWSLQGLAAFENRMPLRNFARLRLTAREGPPSALGARVALLAGGKLQHDLMQVVEGFQTQVPLDLNFGLGDSQSVQSVTVTWPSGAVEVWRDLPVNRLLELTQGEARARVAALPAWPRDGLGPAALQELARATPVGDADGRAVVLFGCAAAEAPDVPADLQSLASAHPDVRFLPRAGLAPEGATFVYDARGRLRRAFGRPPQPADLAALLEGLADEPPFPELSVLSGRRSLELGLHEEALVHFRAALAGNPGLASAAEGIARAERLRGDLSAAEEAYELSVRIDPDYAIGHFNLGVIRTRTGRAELALRAFEEALRIQGERPETLLALAEAAVLAERPPLALAVLERALRADPENPAPHLLRAKILGREQRYAEAKVAFERALELDPESEEAARGLRLVEHLLDAAR